MEQNITDLPRLLHLLTANNVDFIIIGGVAAIIHGSSRFTQDIDIVYRRNQENIQYLAFALRDQEPYLRGAPPGLPFKWSSETIKAGLNFTLITKLGAIDLFGEILEGGRYEELLANSVEVELFGMKCRCLDLETLIRVKRATGRPKDLETTAELEAILEEMRRA
jgi:predicted nucleotidyltransferase